MVWLMGLLSVVVGALNTVQSGSNATLGKVLHQPILAALVVTGVNCVTYLAVASFVGLGLPTAATASEVPWWAWIGGLLGGMYVLASIFFAEKLGAAIFTGLTVTAGVLMSVVLDHYGLAGFKQQSVTWPRIAGAVLMVGGLALISIY